MSACSARERGKGEKRGEGRVRIRWRDNNGCTNSLACINNPLHINENKQKFHIRHPDGHSKLRTEAISVVYESSLKSSEY